MRIRYIRRNCDRMRVEQTFTKDYRLIRLYYSIADSWWVYLGYVFEYEF